MYREYRLDVKNRLNVPYQVSIVTVNASGSSFRKNGLW